MEIPSVRKNSVPTKRKFADRFSDRGSVPPSGAIPFTWPEPVNGATESAVALDTPGTSRTAASRRSYAGWRVCSLSYRFAGSETGTSSTCSATHGCASTGPARG